MPEVYEPIPGEMVAYGLSLENSDFGNGALSVRAYPSAKSLLHESSTLHDTRTAEMGIRLTHHDPRGCVLPPVASSG